MDCFSGVLRDLVGDQGTAACTVARMSVKRTKPAGELGPNESGWVCLYPVPDGAGRKYKRKKFRTKRGAEDFERKAHEAFESHSSVDTSRAEKVTVGQLHREHQQFLGRSGGRGNTGAAPNSLESYENIYRTTISPRWHHAPLSTVTPAAVRDWVERGDFPSPGRKAQGVRQFNRLVAYADGRYVIGNPVKPLLRFLPRSEKQDVERMVLTLRQVFRLSACAPAHYADMFTFLALTGLRFGELAALRGRDVSGNMLAVRRTQRTVSNRISYADVTKGGEKRSIPLTRMALDIAESRRSGRDDHLFTAPRGGDLSNTNLSDRGLSPALELASTAVERLQAALGVPEYSGDFHVYGTDTGAAVERVQREHNLLVTGRADSATRQAVGLPDAQYGYTLEPGDTDFDSGFTLHGFRHTCVSLVVAAGANVKLAQRFAGHSKASQTLDTYSHLFDENLDGVAEVLGTLVDRARGSVTAELDR